MSRSGENQEDQWGGVVQGVYAKGKRGSVLERRE